MKVGKNENNSNMKLFKYGIDIFNSRDEKYGGFNHFLSGIIFRWKLSYLTIHYANNFNFRINHNNDEYYHDGYHNYLHIGFVIISYGT